MAPTNAKSLMKEFRASFRRKKAVDTTPKPDKAKELEEEELAKLVELKENLGDDLPPQYTDAELLGFLRARSLNVKEAEKLMKLDVSSKRFLQIETYEPTELDMNYRFSVILGYDKEGSLVRLLNVGECDFKGFVHSVSTIQACRMLLCVLQRDLALQQAENKKTGRNSRQFSYILNFENLSLGQITYKPVLDTAFLALKLLQDHEHDLAKKIYIVNVPSFFSTVYKMFKPVIQESLHKRLKICDGGVDDWKDELLNMIDADLLPEYLGGNLIGYSEEYNRGGAKEMGGIIPESYYSDQFLDPEDPEVITATIPAGSSMNFRFAVSDPNTVIWWHIQSKDNDLGVGLYIEPLNSGIETPRTQRKKAKEEDMSNMDPLAPLIRCQCHICPEVGCATLWLTGTLVLHFDNTYSWMNAKEVLFKIILEPPKQPQKNYINSRIQAIKAMERMTIKS